MRRMLDLFDDFDEVPKQQYLADTLPRSFAKSTFDTQERKYLPYPSIEKTEGTASESIISTDTILREFRREEKFNQYTDDDQNSLVSWVSRNARKVFATTIQCQLDPRFLLLSMVNFWHHDFTDENLPIEDPSAYPKGRSRLPKPAAFHERIWPEFKHSEFFTKQWICLAPVFTSNKYEYDLRSQCILPFERADTGPRGGSFSSVYKVIVHKAHQERHSSCEVSRKSLFECPC